MKVILLQDVAKIGRRYDVVDVPHGHALNFLIPRGMAEAATPEAMKKLESRKINEASKIAAGDEAFDAALTKLAEGPITMSAQANSEGKLFKGIKAEDVTKQLEEAGITLTPQQLVLGNPIKETGEHSIDVISGEKKGVLTLTVNAS